MRKSSCRVCQTCRSTESTLNLKLGLVSELARLDTLESAGKRKRVRGCCIFVGSLMAGALVAAACGYLVGLPSLRLRGDYLAIVTLGFGEIVRVLIQSQTTDVLYDAQEIAQLPVYKWPLHTGGSLGFSGLPPYASLFWAWLFAGITLLVAFRLKYSSTGRAFLSIREDEVAAAAMGVNTTKYKVRAFVIAAALAGIAGGLFAHTTGVQLNPGELGFQKSFDIIIMVVLGGLGSISGAAIAATLLTLLPEALREPRSLFPDGLYVLIPLAILISIFTQRRWRALAVLAGVVAGWELMRWGAREAGVKLSDYRMVLYALMLITVMIVRPMGLLGVGEIWDRSLWTRRRRGKGKP
ncbi:branched-chain amino acid ABC transporter permease [Leptolyngbya sp. 7M]|uniref:branched-chain amino acid ABC transporter permease n=1 Tax=Leptolyngbya sp. 7M TaxID=2812896 RepID=UPI002938F9AE|nr:branched-chain amino acid ABC transporter permease [Leptolyngbya sp. 7M]